MREHTKQTMQAITDCFTGADGGIQFAQFKGLLEVLDERAANGDRAAQECLGVMERFNKLLNVPAKVAEETFKPKRRKKT